MSFVYLTLDIVLEVIQGPSTSVIKEKTIVMIKSFV